MVPSTIGPCDGAGNALFAPFILKQIILPRQARDKHRRHSRKRDDAFSAGLNISVTVANTGQMASAVSVPAFVEWCGLQPTLMMRTNHSMVLLPTSN